MENDMSATRALRSLATVLLAASTFTASAVTPFDEPQAPAELLVRNFSPQPIHGLVFQGDTTRAVFVPLGGSQTIWLRGRSATVEIEGPPRLVEVVELSPRSRVVVDYPGPRGAPIRGA